MIRWKDGCGKGEVRDILLEGVIEGVRIAACLTKGLLLEHPIRYQVHEFV